MKKFELENCRTKEELKAFLAGKGLVASDEAIENLKKKYEQNLQNTNILTNQQLNDVAGGLDAFVLDAQKGENLSHNRTRRKNGCVSEVYSFEDCKIVLIPNGRKEFNVYNVPTDDLVNGKVDFKQFKNDEHSCPIDSDEYKFSLFVAKQATGLFYEDGKNAYGSTLKEPTAEEQFILNLDVSGISHQEAANVQNPDSCTLL